MSYKLALFLNKKRIGSVGAVDEPSARLSEQHESHEVRCAISEPQSTFSSIERAA
ncbi:MAG: hypothetical protein IKX31_01910 [Muribaculaceae bacterium]|nr:hypothetical protein [Muribaculaceae bacterium]